MSQLCRMIAPVWATDLKKVLEGEFSDEQIAEYNSAGYNVYYLPNSPTRYDKGTIVDGSQIDNFDYIFVDYDTKSNTYFDKQAFIDVLVDFDIVPTMIIDSGNGIHAYWKVTDLNALSYLRLQRRLVRCLRTDEATCSIYQLMRLPGTVNTKIQDDFKLCELLYSSSTNIYTCEQLDKVLPAIEAKDEEFCLQHFDKTYRLDRNNIQIDDTMPSKFGQLLRDSLEAKELWTGPTGDRSKNDYRLGHLMFANGFTKDEARSVLANSAKALQRAPIHRISYADNIIDKIWTFEAEPSVVKLSNSVKDILAKSGDTLKGTSFRCHPRIDNTEHGFRLGQVIGLVAGSGVGKTAFAMNMFLWFTQQNPDYHHFFIPLEQPGNEIADRWQTMCGKDTSLHDKVHVLSNYDEEGNFRHLSFDEIKAYILEYQAVNNIKVGCIVIDHIGALKKKGAKDENQDLMTICHAMKAFAVQTNTLLVMQSQSNRDKAGIGDLELNKDAAYGTVFFESYCDYLITLWQPLKRCHNEPACPTVTAFKFCKIRHKKARRDVIQEDVPYFFYFDSESELMRDMTQDEVVSFNYFIAQATHKRKADRKTDLVAYTSVPYKLVTP